MLKSFIWISRTLLAATLLVVLGAGAVLAQAPTPPEDSRLPESRSSPQMSFAPLARKTTPAVVNIYTSKAVRARRGPTLFDDPFFRRFFGEMIPPGSNGPRDRAQNSLGSGVIVRPEGLIVTNAHVIEGADQITVVLADRRQFPAQVIGSDERTDLAVLRIAKVDAITASRAGIRILLSQRPGPGHRHLRGRPDGDQRHRFALAHTNVGVSDINSSNGRHQSSNSGSAVNLDSRLIGINTAITAIGGSHGIGFAIPSTMVRAVIGASQRRRSPDAASSARSSAQ